MTREDLETEYTNMAAAYSALGYILEVPTFTDPPEEAVMKFGWILLDVARRVGHVELAMKQ